MSLSGLRKNGLKFTSGERALELTLRPLGVRDPEGVPLMDPAVPDACELMCAWIPENVLIRKNRDLKKVLQHFHKTIV